jgi:hypothetical protein
MTKAEFMLHNNQFSRGERMTGLACRETITRLACRVQLLELQLQSLIWAAYIPFNMTTFFLDYPTDHRVLGNELKSAEALLGDKS